MIKQIVFSLFLFILPCFGIAETEDILPGFLWEQKFTNNLAEELCDPAGFIMGCFETDSKNCSEQIHRMAHTCLQSERIPSKVNIYDQGIKLGFKVGQCVGKKAQNELKKPAEVPEKCGRADAWL